MRVFKQNGFTQVELLACMGAFTLILAVITPALGTSGSRADRVACFNNLRHLGNALRHYALEHNDSPPWLPWSPAGNFNHPAKHELWFQYWWIRDSIGSPKYLMDPGETRVGARVATNWDLNPNGGLQAMRNNAVAYALGLDSATFIPQTIMVADRHITHSGFGGCSSGISHCRASLNNDDALERRGSRGIRQLGVGGRQCGIGGCRGIAAHSH